MKKTDQPLESFYALYKLSLQFENRSPRTVDTNVRRLGQFATWARRVKERAPILADFSVESVQQYAAYLRTKKRWDDNPHVPTDDSHLSPFSIQDHVRTLKAFSSWLYREGHTHENVLKRLPMPKVPKLLVEPLTEDEIKKVFASIKTKTKIGSRDSPSSCCFWTRGFATRSCAH
jgi:site-specific recombinase XerD